MQEENSEILRDFAFRLNTAADRAGLSQVEIAARLGAKTPRVNNWFKGKNFPRALERPKLSTMLGVASDWLYAGVGEPEKYSGIQEDSVNYGGTPVRSIPLISWTHAGAAATYEAMPKHFQGSISSMSRDKRAFALTIEGDSMEPKFLAGDRVVCEPSNQPRNGKPAVVKYADDAVQLRIYHKLPDGKIRLAAVNPIYPTIEHKASDFEWIFPVSELNRPI